MKISCMPYAHYDGIPTMRDSEIKSCFTRMVEDGTVYTVFHDGAVRIDIQFIDFVLSPGRKFIVCRDEGQNIIACAWLDNFRQNTAYAHFCLFSSVWGEGSFDVGRYMVQWALNFFGLDMILGFLPAENRRAIDFSKECGAVEVATVPCGSLSVDGKPMPTTILYYTGKGG